MAATAPSSTDPQGAEALERHYDPELNFRPMGRRAALSLGLVSGNRNMALAFAVTGAFEPDLLLYLAVAQIPIYLSPLLTRQIYGRLLGPSGEAGDAAN